MSDEADLSTLGKRLECLRNLAGLSQRGLGTLCGVSGQSIGLIETGKRTEPSGVALVRVARVLGTTVEWLVDGNGDAPTKDEVGTAVAMAQAQAQPEGDAA